MPTNLQLLRGTDTPPPEFIPLVAGPLRMTFDPQNAFLRYIRYGDREVLRGVYVGVRDHNWDTILPAVSNVALEQTSGGFSVTFEASCRQHEVDFSWRGAILGGADGRVTFEMEGKANSEFRRNRIGFCILHAPSEVAGRRCRVEKDDGATEEGRFPEAISPNQPFMDMRAIFHEVTPGVEAEVRFEGDVFEMEDQRNWTDASYKTYCTPLSEPFPVAVAPGDSVSQSVSVRLHGKATVVETPEPPLTLAVGTERFRPIPDIGLGMASHGDPLTEEEIECLRILHLSHLRVDIRLAEAAWELVLLDAAAQALALSASLEVALFVSAAARAELKALASLVEKEDLPVCRWFVFHVAEPATTESRVALAREALGPLGIPIVAGTNAYFTELNRQRPPVDLVDGVCYSMTPQVHAFDDTSLMETLVGQAWTVQSAQLFSADRTIHISPVTLRARFNPNATGGGQELEPGALPEQVDPRQASLVGAAWTAGSLAQLAGSDVASLTYYETSGWRGLMDRSTGDAPDAFPSVPNGVFPLYHIFAWVGGMRGGQVMEATSSDMLRVQILGLRKGSWARLLIANVTGTTQTVRVQCPGLVGDVRLEALDHTTVETAVTEPASFRGLRDIETTPSAGGTFEVALNPFGVVCAKAMLAP